MHKVNFSPLAFDDFNEFKQTNGFKSAASLKPPLTSLARQLLDNYNYRQSGWRFVGAFNKAFRFDELEGHSDEGRTNNKRIFMLTIHVPKKQPHIFVNNRKNDTIVHEAHEIFSRKQRLEVESIVFNKRFDLYLIEDYAIDSLDIVDPRFIYLIQSFGPNVDVECIENKIILYFPHKSKHTTRLQAYKTVFRLGIQLDKLFSHKQTVWRFEPTSTPTKLNQSSLTLHALSKTKAALAFYTLLGWLLPLILLAPLWFLFFSMFEVFGDDSAPLLASILIAVIGVVFLLYRNAMNSIWP